MSKKYFLILLVMILGSSLIYAQRENVWVFGKIAGKGRKLDFNSVIPVVDSLPFFGTENAASVCDLSGQLLFYTEGDTIWNKNGIVMPNGQGLTGLPNVPIFPNSPVAWPAAYSCRQGSLIVPMLNSPDQYYVFSLTDRAVAPILGVYGNLYYSIVDMSLNNGLGDVVPGQKGILVDSNFTESMTGVAGDGCKVWVVLAAFSDSSQSNLFKSFEITENGINPTPVVSDVGWGASESLRADLCMMGISSDGKKLSRSRYGFSSHSLELFDFDPGTGSVSHLVNLDSIAYGYMGMSFSPDNSKLYAVMRQSAGGISKIVQFDLADTASSAIINSKIVIDSTDVFGDIKCAMDGKIYYAPTPDFFNSLKVINYPNLVGMACQPDNTIFQVKLSGQTTGIGSFGNHVPVPTPDTDYVNNHQVICAGQVTTLQFSDTGAFWIAWDDGSTGDSRTITDSGTYWVRHGTYCHLVIDTFLVSKDDLSPVITVNVFDLGTTVPYSTYQWFLNGNIIPGATNAIYTVTENGDYTVAVSNENGCTDTAAIYTVTNVTGIRDISAIAEKINIYPNPAYDIIHINAPVKIKVRLTGVEGRLLKEMENATAVPVADLATGVYLLQITDKEGTLLKVERFIKAK